MDDQYADQAWAMLALGAPDGAGSTSASGRINAFIGRDQSQGKKRSALLVAGLAGLGRIDAATAEPAQQPLRASGSATARSWTRMIDRAAAFGQSGTVLVLTGTGFQAADVRGDPAGAPLPLRSRRSSARGQDFTARMIAAEALART